MPAFTIDGHEISTIEQDGGYAGHEIGRVWLRHPQPQDLAHTIQPWTWYACGTVAQAREAARLACTLTAAEFERCWETSSLWSPTRERLSWRPKECTA
jgi:hypothetical protein